MVHLYINSEEKREEGKEKRPNYSQFCEIKGKATDSPMFDFHQEEGRGEKYYH